MKAYELQTTASVIFRVFKSNVKYLTFDHLSSGNYMLVF